MTVAKLLWFCLVGVDLWFVILLHLAGVVGGEIKMTSSDGFVGEDSAMAGLQVCFLGDLCVVVFPCLEGQCLLAGVEL